MSKDSARSGLSSDRNELFMVCVKVVGFQKLVWNVGCCFGVVHLLRLVGGVASVPQTCMPSPLISSARRQTYSGSACDDYWLVLQAGYGVILGKANRNRFGGGR